MQCGKRLGTGSPNFALVPEREREGGDPVKKWGQDDELDHGDAMGAEKNQRWERRKRG